MALQSSHYQACNPNVKRALVKNRSRKRGRLGRVFSEKGSLVNCRRETLPSARRANAGSGERGEGRGERNGNKKYEVETNASRPVARSPDTPTPTRERQPWPRSPSRRLSAPGGCALTLAPASPPEVRSAGASTEPSRAGSRAPEWSENTPASGEQTRSARRSPEKWVSGPPPGRGKEGT